MAAIITRRLAKESFKKLRFSVSSLRKLESKSHIHTRSILVPCRTHLRKFHVKRYFHSTPVFQGEIVSFKLSDIGEGIREVNVKDWFVSVGDHVTQFQSICEVQSDKASVTITSRYDGKITKIYYEVDDIALVGQPLVDIELAGDESGSQQDSHEQYSSSDSSDDDHFAEKSKGEKVLTTPAVRKIAKENKVKLSDVKGTGRDGRILKEDVLRYVQAKTKGPEKPAAQPSKPPVQEIKTPPPPPPKAVPVIKPQIAIGEDRTEKIKGIRKSMVKTMTEAHSIPVFGYDDEYDVSELVNFKDHVKDVTLASGVKFTYMPVIIKAVSLALSQYPILNSSVDSTCENIIYKAAHNISIAMDTADGLLVPNVKNVQSLSIMDIATELNRLQSLGNDGKLGTSELSGGTFSLSNIGAIGGTYARPVILPPNVAIGALGKFQALPRFDKDGNIKKVHILNVSWSADHRIIEGACMARFSNVLKAYLENPLSMLLYLR